MQAHCVCQGKEKAVAPGYGLFALFPSLPFKMLHQKMDKAGPMPEPRAVFYLLQFPANFLCSPGSDLSLTGDSI